MILSIPVLLLLAAAAVQVTCENGVPQVEPVPGAEQPEGLNDIPLYSDFYNSPELYRRVLILVERLERDPDSSLSLLWRTNSPEAFVEISTVGDDTGSSRDFFSIGEFETQQRPANNTLDSDGIPNALFTWNEKAFVIYKMDGTESIDFEILDFDLIGANDELMKLSISTLDLPEPGDGFVEYRLAQVEGKEVGYNELEGAELVVQIKVSEMNEPFTTNEDNIMAKTSIPGRLEYGEYVLDLDGDEKALVQTWIHTDGGPVDGAVLWVIGRNDCFMHPHVLKELFLGNEENTVPRYDVYVLNWRFNGLARFRGFLTDAFLSSHVKNGTFDPYNQEIELSLELMQNITQNGYHRVLAYAHSTGAPILLNYIIENGNDDFDAIILNSPFLDWGEGGSTAIGEFVENALSTVVGNLDRISNDRLFVVRETPDVFDPIMYLTRSVAPSDFTARIFSHYRVDWAVRPLYAVPMTGGFARASIQLHSKIADAGVITNKPMLVLASKADDVLTGYEIAELSGNINPDRELALLTFNAHDVFLSPDEDDTILAMNITKEWMTRTLDVLERNPVPTAPPTTAQTATNGPGSSVGAGSQQTSSSMSSSTVLASVLLLVNLIISL